MKKIGEKIASAIRVIITALLWVATAMYFYILLFSDYAMRKRTLLLLMFLVIVVLVVTLSIMIWRAYNFRRFGKRDRRKSASPVTIEEIGSLFGLSNISVEALRTSSSLTLAVARRYDRDKEYEVLTITGGGARHRVSRPAVPQNSSAYTRAEDSSG